MDRAEGAITLPVELFSSQLRLRRRRFAQRITAETLAQRLTPWVLRYACRHNLLVTKPTAWIGRDPMTRLYSASYRFDYARITESASRMGFSPGFINAELDDLTLTICLG